MSLRSKEVGGGQLKAFYVFEVFLSLHKIFQLGSTKDIIYDCKI